VSATGSITLTVGWIGRHTPKGAGAGGREAAILDIAQDLLLRELHETGALDALVFKGGTALRKLYAGNQGRFSLDLDFSLAIPADPEAVVLELVGAIDGTKIGPFAYGVSERRGKWSLTVTSPFGEGDAILSSKLDVSPPVWLDPARRGWVAMPVHATYGTRPLPALQVMRIEENLAEKISRLNRTTTARDMYDLAWVAQNQHNLGGLDLDLVRRLAVLKIWVDARGLSGTNVVWKPGHEPRGFDPAAWLRVRSAREFDLDDIGALAVPVPTEAELANTVSSRYAFLADIDAEERQLAQAREQDRGLALDLLAKLPGARLAHVALY
jgi:predicted nucleotidyltransferase component of viral defense system